MVSLLINTCTCTCKLQKNESLPSLKSYLWSFQRLKIKRIKAVYLENANLLPRADGPGLFQVSNQWFTWGQLFRYLMKGQ